LKQGYDKTLVCSAERGFYADTTSEVFALWKNKLLKHEDKLLQHASTQFRNEKREEKIR
jgi:hypothetical protein